METVTVLPSPIVYNKRDPNIDLDVREEGRQEEGVLFDPPGEQSPEQLKSLRKSGPGNLDTN